MASRSAGTLVTSQRSAYIPPPLMPGYRGHVPTLKYDYGETFGHQTAKHFQDYRSSCLNSSEFPLSKGGAFPTYYTHNPELVISNRSRTRDRFLAQPQYRLINQHHDRTMALKGFSKSAADHREYYTDKSASVKRVDSFMVPKTNEDQYKEHVPFLVLSQDHSDSIALPQLNHVARRNPIVPHYSRNVLRKDRSIRDVFFERR